MKQTTATPSQKHGLSGVEPETGPHAAKGASGELTHAPTQPQNLPITGKGSPAIAPTQTSESKAPPSIAIDVHNPFAVLSEEHHQPGPAAAAAPVPSPKKVVTPDTTRQGGTPAKKSGLSSLLAIAKEKKQQQEHAKMMAEHDRKLRAAELMRASLFAIIEHLYAQTIEKTKVLTEAGLSLELIKENNTEGHSLGEAITMVLFELNCGLDFRDHLLSEIQTCLDATSRTPANAEVVDNVLRQVAVHMWQKPDITAEEVEFYTSMPTPVQDLFNQVWRNFRGRAAGDKAKESRREKRKEARKQQQAEKRSAKEAKKPGKEAKRDTGHPPASESPRHPVSTGPKPARSQWTKPPSIVTTADAEAQDHKAQTAAARSFSLEEDVELQGPKRTHPVTSKILEGEGFIRHESDCLLVGQKLNFSKQYSHEYIARVTGRWTRVMIGFRPDVSSKNHEAFRDVKARIPAGYEVRGAPNLVVPKDLEFPPMDTKVCFQFEVYNPAKHAVEIEVVEATLRQVLTLLSKADVALCLKRVYVARPKSIKATSLQAQIEKVKKTQGDNGSGDSAEAERDNPFSL